MAVLIPLLVLVAALVGGVYKIQLEPILELAGVWRTPEARGTERCRVVTDLPACEKIVLDKSSGLIYAACSTIDSRVAWTPALHNLNASARSMKDYVAVYDPATNKHTRLALTGLDDPRGLNTHGMDVVPSSTNPSELWLYLVNQRPPPAGAPADAFTDPSVEIFRHTRGARAAVHVRTVASAAAMPSPNDVVGAADGTHFWFTNDGTHLGALAHARQTFLGAALTHVGYCHVDEGCKVAVGGLRGANGLVRVDEDTFFVGSASRGEVRVLERQADNSLVMTDYIAVDMPMDNLSVDKNGAVWAAGFPKAKDLLDNHFPKPHDFSNPTSAVRIALNTGSRSAFFGEKYKVEKPFQSDGKETANGAYIASGSTTVVYDAQREKFFASGLASPGITVCDLSVAT